VSIDRSKETKTILYVGPLALGGTCLQRMRAFRELGHSLTSINPAPNWVMKHQKPPLYYKIINKLIGPPDFARVNRQIVQLVRRETFDLVWVDKVLEIKPETLRKVKEWSPRTIIVGYSPDDMGSQHNQSKNFLACLLYYDLYCTTKTYNIQELKDLGCPRVRFTGNAYDPATHRPMDLSAEEKERFGGPVGFIGSFEAQRAKSISFLAEHGIRVGVWGHGWQENCKLNHKNLVIKGGPIYGDDYAKAICSFDIVLGFLRKLNRDLQTSRSIEIPACGAFMLAERTDEHLELFEEGKDAEFFGTNEELLEKVRYYLAHEAERKQIARAGRERCLKSGYSNHERLKEILARIDRAGN
jgi:spore maturation protein CgeB